MDMKADKDAKEVYTLLNENYVEDDDNMFRFDYSINFLRWALMPPGCPIVFSFFNYPIDLV